MSVFKVKLNNNSQGRMDLDPSTNVSDTYGQIGSPFTTSLQRQVYVAGPNGSYRQLSDGETFTDCNYWKQFTSDEMGAENSFIEVLTDDGSTYVAGEESTFSVGETKTLTTAFSGTTIDFVTDHGGPARFLMVQNLDASINVTGELNGDTNITFVVGAGETMMFNQGDMSITSLRLKGASGTPQASYIASIKSTCNS